MKVITVNVSKGRTVNLGDYNSVQFRYGMTVELEEGDTYKEAFDFAEKNVDDRLDEEHSRWK